MGASDEPRAPLGAGGPAPVGRPGPSWTGDGSLKPRARPRVPATPREQRVRVAPNGAVLASFWLRVGAFAIDLVIQMVLLAPVWIFMTRGVDLSSQSTRELMASEWVLPMGIAQTVLRLGYNAYFNAGGASPGKRMMKLRIVQRIGTPPGLRLGFLRGAVTELGYLFWFAPVDHLWAVFDGQTQTWHDKLAGTWVVRAEAEDELKS